MSRAKANGGVKQRLRQGPRRKFPLNFAGSLWPVGGLCFLLLGLGSCASVDAPTDFALTPEALSDDEQEVQIVPQDIITYPGKVTLAAHPWQSSSVVQSLKCDGKEIPYYFYDGHLKAFLTESYFAKLPRHYVCFVTYTYQGQSKTKDLWHVAVKKFKYAKERLQVDKKHIVLSKADQERVAQEKIMTSAIYRQGRPRPYFRTPFVRPLPSKITSYYGRKRIFNKGYRSQHLGTDFRAAIGTPIKNVNAGKVVLTKDLFYTGNTVIVDHGLDIFSVYGHLSEIK
ncbi:MAG: M23 family metallopeptidase, partial [Bacteriovoracaceae bacterium]|nr:M23 family metallopeptidase [Bacteriovoracaceae bacterium]